jgi:hypothetical protein
MYVCAVWLQYEEEEDAVGEDQVDMKYDDDEEDGDHEIEIGMDIHTYIHS